MEGGEVAKGFFEDSFGGRVRGFGEGGGFEGGEEGDLVGELGGVGSVEAGVELRVFEGIIKRGDEVFFARL